MGEGNERCFGELKVNPRIREVLAEREGYSISNGKRLVVERSGVIKR
jgi:hypothetical protein